MTITDPNPNPTPTPTTIGRAIGEFGGVHEVWPRGDRLQAVQEAAARYKQRFQDQGEIRAARSFDIAVAPYMTAFAFHGAATSPNPYVSMINRIVVVQYTDFQGTPRTLLWEPTVPAGSARAPFYAQLLERSQRNPLVGLVGKLVNKEYHTPSSALDAAGLRPDEVDYLSFDHLHVQDPRMVCAAFPHAKLLVQRREVATFASAHPMQWAWYVDGGLDGVAPERMVLTRRRLRARRRRVDHLDARLHRRQSLADDQHPRRGVGFLGERGRG